MVKVTLFAAIVAASSLSGCGKLKERRETRDGRNGGGSSLNTGGGDAEGKKKDDGEIEVSKGNDEDIPNEVKVPADKIPLKGQATFKACDDLGLTYIALGEPECGEPKAEFTCCKEQILARFPEGKEKIEKIFEDKKDFKFYHCGQISTLKLRLHFLANDGQGRTTYRTSIVKGKPVQPKEEVTCAKIDTL